MGALNRPRRQRPPVKRPPRRIDPRALSARNVYHGSDGALTRAYLRFLEKQGHAGRVAAQLFRCQKSSSRAKQYRGDYVGLAYDRKGEALDKLCELLADDAWQKPWGWGEDPAQDYAPHVLYIDLPHGQVSFHSLTRYAGPDYPGRWDGRHESEYRIILFCATIAAAADEANTAAAEPKG